MMIKKNNQILKKKYRKIITCLTAYSPSIAQILDGSVDFILIGDSLGSTLYGMNNTRCVTLNMMMNHGYATIKKIKKSLSIIDMPFKTYENPRQALYNAKKLINYTKANLIKLEINKKKLPILKYLIKNKINVVAHIGVTPQSYKNFSNIKIVGKNKAERQSLKKLALDAEFAGAEFILLECVTEETAKIITSSVSIPTIGIGASKYCDGQILVFDDLVNMTFDKNKPKFVKSYMNFANEAKRAIKKYTREVELGKFPGKRNTYK